MKLNKASWALLGLLFFYACGFESFEIASVEDFESVTAVDEEDRLIIENPWTKVSEQPISTFSIDADGASYSYTRQFLQNNQAIPASAIRTEELINYFNFDYPDSDEHPISLNGEISTCPWAEGHQLLRIGIKGENIPEEELPPSNFVFLIDVSGSMSGSSKLGLLKEAFKSFVNEILDEEDKISIVTYAGKSKTLLNPTPGSFKNRINNAIDKLKTGGGTNGEGGIIRAYELAQEAFIPGGNNRVILGTDGDFNIGVSSQEELVDLIEEKRELGIFLTTIGVGTGNFKDVQLEQIANNGNGTYEYLDNLEQAKKVFIYEYNKFYTVAKDVKVQIEFNPELIAQYRLIGYENRLLATEDFEDDKKDAGEIGSNQTITALYELIPSSKSLGRGQAITIDFRYKEPDSDQSTAIDHSVSAIASPFLQASENMRFATSVAGYGLLLRDSEYKGSLSYDDVLHWAEDAKSFDPHGFREEFIQLVYLAKNQ